MISTIKCQNVQFLPSNDLRYNAPEVYGEFKDEFLFFRKTRIEGFDYPLMVDTILETGLPAFVYTLRNFNHPEKYHLYTTEKEITDQLLKVYKQNGGVYYKK